MKYAFRRTVTASVLAAALIFAPAFAQTPSAERVAVRSLAQARDLAALEREPDANRTREELNELLHRHAPALRRILALDPTLLNNQAYLASYPGLPEFLAAHPDIARNPSFYLGSGDEPRRDAGEQVLDIWQNVLGGMAAFLGFGIAIGLLTWLIRTLIDYRRWSRLSKVQAEVHTKLLDRFSSNEELMAYIQSPAGAKFLESSPIKLDPGPRSLGAPLGRILWSLQGGVVLVSAGIGLWFISARVGPEAAQAIQSFGVLALALGMGFVVSAIISYGVARKLGLIDPAPHASPSEPSGV
ncbi:MAG TPA: hypothetical protein PKJ41_03950 [Bryobacteraceae bacterium]|nr:hypothetical protein [Bryobacteraceae bacterium]HPT26175.1 hypothetical protein [Bryobacteraceae bacterium]